MQNNVGVSQHDDAPPHRAARVGATCAPEVRHPLPPKLPQIQPPHRARVPFPPVTQPPLTTSRRRVRSHAFAPSREALHTPVSRHAPASPLCSATRVQNSGSAVTREAAQRADARVVGAMTIACSFLLEGASVCVLCQKRKSAPPYACRCIQL
jgi:hypothetical protein